MTKTRIKMVGFAWPAIPKKIRIRTMTLALAAICGLSVLPDKSIARSLNDIACDGLWRGCLGNCGATGNSQACTDKCDDNRVICKAGGTNSKQQTPPPPCTGIRCNLPTKPHPPTTVSNPPSHGSLKPEPVQPVGKSNPNSPGSGGNNPVIYERKNDSGGSQSGGHESGGGGHGR